MSANRKNGIGDWKGIGDMIRDINHTAQKLDQNKIAPRVVAEMSKLFRCNATLIGHALNHADRTGRLRKGQMTLPLFKFGN